MKTKLTLDQFQITSTRDVEKAEAILSSNLTELRIRKASTPGRFGLRMNGVDFGRTQIIFNKFAADTRVDPGEVEEAVLLVIGCGKPSVVHIDGEQVVCTGDIAAIISPSRRVFNERPAGSGVLVLRASSGAIEQRYREDTGRGLSKGIVFEDRANLTKPPWTALSRSLEFLLETLQDDPSVLEHPHFRRGFDDLLLGGLLSLPHSHHDRMGRRVGAAMPRVVRQAKEFMEAQALEAIAIPDILRACNCSRSVLFASFQQFCGYSPMQFLVEERLRLVRARLLDPHPDDTVTYVAYDCGFTHLGRFGNAYRKMFGEPPSQTLKSNR